MLLKVDVHWMLYDGIEYITNSTTPSPAIDLLHTAEGVARRSGTAYSYEYFLKDHLANTRIVFNKAGTIYQQTDYYPFGMEIGRYLSGPKNKYLYNGIEKNDELGTYEAQYRELDPITGRWWQIDPEIENMEAWSPYASNYDNPITYSDPLGDDPDEYDGGGDDPPAKGFWPGVRDGFTGYFKDAYHAVTHPGETLSNMVKPENLVDYALDAVTIGNHGRAKQAINAYETVNDQGTYGLGKVVGKTGAEVTVVVVTNGAGRGIRLLKGEGIVCERVDKTGNIAKPYVGQAKSEARYAARQKEHARANPRSDFEFKKIDRGRPGRNLDKKEQRALDKRGGPTNKPNPNGGTSNKKNVIKKDKKLKEQ
ncbi:hypothetical protein A8C56_14155 [Niabella ginsenosidivorans]|uniref:RHS repeat-associated core domain-containing protein n=1 Tax=Niabella ginsenosidivorans TaxID=1176587 RepID=A0A1A9I2R6_9BACT|nr:RHS repeat-associated core domain-containing protein [Niabella ginsenosidivorans]ANH81958.1 hypothetical protein A8C56_14155 [Niabella ginsenosidivorans]